MAWNLKYDGAVPPLPAKIRPEYCGKAESRDRKFEEVFRGQRPLLKHGCWAVRLEPCYADDVEMSIHYSLCYEGTLRLELEGVERTEGLWLRGSGDLYRYESGSDRQPLLGWRWKTYPRRDYGYYLGLDALEVVNRSEIIVTLDVYRFDQASAKWRPDGQLTATLLRQAGGAHPWLAGEVTNERGTTVGRLEIRHFSEFLRQAVVQMDRVERAEFPPESGVEMKDGRRLSLESIFAEAGWRVKIELGAKPTGEPTGPVWSSKALHRQMLQSRGPSGNLDEQWRYHVLVVRRIRNEKFNYFGTMYDAWPTDSNQVPREGVAVAYKARFPLELDHYGKERAGQVLGKVPRIFLHTVVHELGHAMGLAHNYTGCGFMQGFDNLAEEAFRTGQELSSLMTFRFDDEDAARLRHLPDAWVRPGGVAFRSGFGFEPVPIEDLAKDNSDLKLEIAPLDSTLPLGAPLRVEFRLTNVGKNSIKAPFEIGLKSGYLSGRIFQDSGEEQPFGTAVRYLFSRPADLEPGKSIVTHETLLRGARGALLPSPGTYRLEAEVAWEHRGGRVRASGATALLVTDKHDNDHPDAALKVLSSRELFPLLVFRQDEARFGDQEEAQEAMAALDSALESNVLGKYYAVLKAKRLAAEAGELDTKAISDGERVQRQKAQLKKAADLISDDTVLTVAEANDLLEMLKRFRIEPDESPASIKPSPNPEEELKNICRDSSTLFAHSVQGRGSGA